MPEHPAFQRRKPLTARVGILGVGLDIYWSQFPGLLETLLGYLDIFEQKVQAWNVETINFGMVDNAAAAYALLPRLKAAHVDLVFIDMLTYATSATFGILGTAATLAAGLRPCHDSYAARERQYLFTARIRGRCRPDGQAGAADDHWHAVR